VTRGARTRAHSEYISANNNFCLSKTKIARSVTAISIEHFTVPAKAGQLHRHQLEIFHQAHLPEKKKYVITKADHAHYRRKEQVNKKSPDYPYKRYGLLHYLLYMIAGPGEVQKLQAAGYPNCKVAAHTRKQNYTKSNL
jgi:hypothetical protein